MKTLLPRGRTSRALAGLTDAAALACGWWLIALSVATCIEMLGRKLLGFSLQGVDEIGSYTYAIVGSVGFAHALVSRSHTRVDFLISRFPVKARSVLNVLAMLSLAAFAVLSVWRGLHVVLESIDLHATASTPLATPMWIPQALWLAGYVLFALVAVWAALHALKLFVRGRHELVNDGFGPQTLEEEIEAETELQLPRGEAAPAPAQPAAVDAIRLGVQA